MGHSAAVMSSSQPGIRTDGQVESDHAWLTPGRFALLLAACICAAFPEEVIGTKTFVYRDFGLFGFPLASYYRDCFWQGQIPLWNPLNNCGLPFLAQWNTLVCYPGSLIYLLLPLPWSLNLYCLGHLLLAGVSMYFLAFGWTGNRLAAAGAGLTFAFSGLGLSFLIWPNNMAALAWMPAVVLLSERAWLRGGRSLPVAAAVGALQMLAGAPEIILYTWLLASVLWLCHAWQQPAARLPMLRRFLIVVAAVTGLCAVQLLPFLDLLLHSHREAQFSTDSWAMPLTGLANFFVPLFHTIASSPGVRFQPEQFWISSYFPGVGVMVLAFWAVGHLRQWRVWLLGALAFAGVWLALGDEGWLHTALRHGLPVANLTRFPIKWVVVAAFALPLLAAFALKQWTARDSAEPAPLSTAWPILAMIMVFVVGALVVARIRPLNEQDWPVTLRSALTQIGFLAAIAGALFALIRMKHAAHRRAVGLVLLSLFWLNVLTHAPWQNPSADPVVYAWKLPPLEAMNPKPAAGQSRAMLSFQAMDSFYMKSLTNVADNFLLRSIGLHDNCNLIHRIPKVDGFYSLYLSEERALRFRLYASTNEIRANLGDFLGVSQVTSPDNELEWSARSTWMPFVTAGQKPVFLGTEELLTNLMSTTFNPRETVLLPLEAQACLTATNRSVCPVVSNWFSAHCVSATVEAREPALVLFAQAHYHPWQATVDGFPAQIWRANHAFQAVEVSPGRHEVVLVYRDRFLQVGAAVSLAALAGCLVWWIRERQRERQIPESG